MAKQYVSMRNLKFMLHDVFDASEVSKHAHFEHIDRDAMDLVLDSALQIADTYGLPAAAEMDRQPSELKDGHVNVHPNVPKFIKAMGEAGLIGSTAPLDLGGSQLPHTLQTGAGFIMTAANNSIVMFTGLTAGAANLIASFGNEELKSTYLEKMYSGEWQGTMCLTEPQAGSSLHYITSSATPDTDGSYKIKGQKIYISAGFYDDSKNVVHLYLAKIDGAPAGTKGISLFVVPQRRLENGQLVDNDVVPIGVYHKMGQRGTPALHLQMGASDNCKGWLVGEPHQGLRYMFQMMNEARLGVGLTGAAIASISYYDALEYANERPQGQSLDVKGQDPNSPQTLIINHPDVKRMLLFQKSVVEGSLSLIMQCAKYADLTEVTEGDEQVKYQLLLDMLTPVAKTYPTEMGIQSVSSSLQCFGGGGFCEDFPLERYYRDIRITSIYEGTTGIQSLALLGRNVIMKNGKAAMLYFQEVLATAKEAQTYDELKKYATTLEAEAQRLQKVTQHLVGFGMKGEAERFLADATLYMEMFGIVAIAWQWLKQGIVAKKALLTANAQGEELQFLESKIHTMKYFFAYEVPKTLGLEARLLDSEVLTVDVEKAIFV